MKKLSIYLLLGLFLTIPAAHALAGIVKLDLSIFEQDLIKAGIKNVEHIEPDLNTVGAKQKMLIKHAITTGRERANNVFILMEIDELEKIRPNFDASKVLSKGEQIALTPEQVNSFVKQLKAKRGEIPEWLSDDKQPKFIHTVLVKHTVTAVTVKDAKALVNWAIKQNRLNDNDHPSYDNY